MVLRYHELHPEQSIVVLLAGYTQLRIGLKPLYMAATSLSKGQVTRRRRVETAWAVEIARSHKGDSGLQGRIVWTDLNWTCARFQPPLVLVNGTAA